MGIKELKALLEREDWAPPGKLLITHFEFSWPKHEVVDDMDAAVKFTSNLTRFYRVVDDHGRVVLEGNK